MRSCFALASCLLFAITIQADRRHTNRRPQFLNRSEQSPNIIEDNPSWAGAVLDKDNGTFAFATGTFVIPPTTGKDGAATSTWVGIDGRACPSDALLQAGVDFEVGNSVTTFDAWYEWYPGGSTQFDNTFPISVGDSIRVNITVFSPTSGMASVENLSNGQYAVKRLSSPHELCGQSAEWIIEDFMDDDNSYFNFADFGTVAFTHAEATGPKGTFSPNNSEATIVEIRKANATLTSVSIHENDIIIEHL